MLSRRHFFSHSAAAGLAAGLGSVAESSFASSTAAPDMEGPDPIFEKPDPISLAELAERRTPGVSAVEVNDYTPGRYTGSLRPSPPHADLNPKKAIVVVWQNSPCRLVFNHEASYIPILELPDGTGMCNDYFGNDLMDHSNPGLYNQADIMNIDGRKERNSFVEIVRGGPEFAWVRWTYFGLKTQVDMMPRFRATEDYLCFANGLTLRRATHRSLMPNTPFGYGNTLVDLYAVLAQGMKFSDCFTQDPKFGDMNVLSMSDLYSDQRYDFYWNEKYWSDKRGARRVGGNESMDDDILGRLSRPKGCALVIPFRKRLLFAILGAASGFDPARSQFIDASVGPPNDRSISPMLQQDHWPIGWSNYKNSGLHHTPYIFHFGNLMQFFTPEGKDIKHALKDPEVMWRDMALMKWIERRVFYVLLGSAASWSEIHRIGRQWLDEGVNCARPETVAAIQTQS